MAPSEANDYPGLGPNDGKHERALDEKVHETILKKLTSRSSVTSSLQLLVPETRSPTYTQVPSATMN